MPAPPSTPSPVLTVRFWGTRGSLPAPLSAAAVRQKLRAALLKADGRQFDEVETSRWARQWVLRQLSGALQPSERRSLAGS